MQEKKKQNQLWNWDFIIASTNNTKSTLIDIADYNLVTSCQSYFFPMDERTQ